MQKKKKKKEVRILELFWHTVSVQALPFFPPTYEICV